MWASAALTPVGQQSSRSLVGNPARFETRWLFHVGHDWWYHLTGTPRRPPHGGIGTRRWCEDSCNVPALPCPRLMWTPSRSPFPMPPFSWNISNACEKTVPTFNANPLGPVAIPFWPPSFLCTPPADTVIPCVPWGGGGNHLASRKETHLSTW